MSSSTGSGYGPMSTPPHKFICIICNIEFESNATQRTHDKSDWHIYNLKRHLTSLPPISSQIYNDRITHVKQTAAAEESDSTSAFHKLCVVCKKDYYSPQAYKNHIKSNNHTQATAEESKDETPASSALEDIASQVEKLGSFSCLFCTRSFSSLDPNMEHMEKSHNFSIPNQDYLFDLEIFIDYLSTLISTFQECIFCGKTRGTAAAVRQHMSDKGHCHLDPDAAGSSEFEDFYFLDSKVAKEGSDETTPINFAPTKDEVLRLPSGRALGHRSQAYSHRQRHISSTALKAVEKVPSSSNSNEDRRVPMSLFRTDNANLGMIGVSELQKRAVLALEKKMMKVEVRARNQHQSRLEKQANKQKFFKPDVPGPKNG
ncbi:hypothetical protein B2J93_4176 [Marssonina coronariae]|uniref:C2H2-type domain-containing protein n=1 Tax=Diplocarpon coronariae TaxID=2795749 RepID=A0A218ZB83_9HELO|nr:hypothetical protein B2J93_4176 [Marssonina coronariae]